MTMTSASCSPQSPFKDPFLSGHLTFLPAFSPRSPVSSLHFPSHFCFTRSPLQRSCPPLISLHSRHWISIKRTQQWVNERLHWQPSVGRVRTRASQNRKARSEASIFIAVCALHVQGINTPTVVGSIVQGRGCGHCRETGLTHAAFASFTEDKSYFRGHWARLSLYMEAGTWVGGWGWEEPVPSLQSERGLL